MPLSYLHPDAAFSFVRLLVLCPPALVAWFGLALVSKKIPIANSSSKREVLEYERTLANYPCASERVLNSDSNV